MSTTRKRLSILLIGFIIGEPVFIKTPECELSILLIGFWLAVVKHEAALIFLKLSILLIGFGENPRGLQSSGNRSFQFFLLDSWCWRWCYST